MFYITIQLGLFIIILLMSTLFTWYEGSGILINSFEWNYSTPFSNMINGEVMSANDVVVWDFFIYAAKFSPAFPIIMILSTIYLIILFGYLIFKSNESFHNFLLVFGTVLMLSSLFLFKAHTYGGKALFTTIIISGFSCLLIGWIIRKNLKFKSNTSV